MTTPAAHALATLTQQESNLLRLYSTGGYDTVLRELPGYRNRADIDAAIADVKAKLEHAATSAPDPHNVIDDFGQARPTEHAHVGARLWLPDHVLECGRCGRRFWPTHPRNRYCPDHRGKSTAVKAKPTEDWPHTNGVARAQTVPDDDDRRPGQVKRARDGMPRPGPLLPSVSPKEDPLPTAEPVTAELGGDVAELRGAVATLVAVNKDLRAQLDDTRREVSELTGRVDALTRQVEGPDVDALDVTLGAVVQGLAQLAGSGKSLAQLIAEER